MKLSALVRELARSPIGTAIWILFGFIVMVLALIGLNSLFGWI